jgi:hypothetical protein
MCFSWISMAAVKRLASCHPLNLITFRSKKIVDFFVPEGYGTTLLTPKTLIFALVGLMQAPTYHF